MTASTKLHQLESKISELQKQHQLLLKERQQEIASLISMAELAHLDDKTLMGGLLFLKEKATSQDGANKSLVEGWRDAGEKFLRRTNLRTYQCSRNKDGKQAEDYSRLQGKQEGTFS